MEKKNNNSPLKWVPSAYFAMGMPFVVLNMVCVLMFKGMGIADAQIALWTSIIMFPWTLKFLWSPFIEMVTTKKKAVVITQIASGVGFGLVAIALHMPSFFAICIAILAVVAFSGATHDIALDGVYMSELTNEQQAKFIGWQGAFYNLAKLVATGLLVYLAGVLKDYFIEANAEEPVAMSWSIIMLSACAILVVLGLYHIFSVPSNAPKAVVNSNAWDELIQVLKEFFTKKYIWLYIAFIILYRFGEGFVMKIVPLFLKSDISAGGLGLSEQQIGLFYGTFGALAFIIGSILGGYYIAHKGLKKALFSLVCIFNIPFLVYAMFAWVSPTYIDSVYSPIAIDLSWISSSLETFDINCSLIYISGGIILEYFGYGFGFVGLTLFMMQQVAPGPHQMAHYAFASAIMNLSVMVTGACSGYVSDALGYKYFFLAVMIATIPVFIMSIFLPFTHPDKQETK